MLEYRSGVVKGVPDHGNGVFVVAGMDKLGGWGGLATNRLTELVLRIKYNRIPAPRSPDKASELQPQGD